MPRKDETAIGSHWYPKFGGKGGNQAVAVARAGAVSRMVGAVGDDDFGVFLRQALAAAGVEHTHVALIPGTGSGMSVAIQDGAGDYAATIVSGANLRIDPASLGDPAIWVDVGLLVLQNEVPEAVNIAAARAARVRDFCRRTVAVGHGCGRGSPLLAINGLLLPPADPRLPRSAECSQCREHDSARSLRLLGLRWRTWAAPRSRSRFEPRRPKSLCRQRSVGVPKVKILNG